jgi:hypothetical protein
MTTDDSPALNQTGLRREASLRSCAGPLYSVAEKSELLSQIATLESPRDRLVCLVELVPHVRGKLQKRAAENAWS